MVLKEKPKALVFGDLADNYAAARPQYPDALFETIAARSSFPLDSAVALDVAAGTGAATRQLVARCKRVVAIEPSRPMLEQATRRAAGSPAWVGGVQAFGEALPIRGDVVDLLTVAQAFHWLEHGPALDEFARVLRSQGQLALLFHIETMTDFDRDVWELIEAVNPGHKRPVTMAMRDVPQALLDHSDFSYGDSVEFLWSRDLPSDRYVRYAFSWSYVGGALELHERDPFEKRLRAIIDRHFGDGPVVDELVSVAHIARRI